MTVDLDVLLDTRYTEFTEILRQLHGMWAGTTIVTHSSIIIIIYSRDIVF